MKCYEEILRAIVDGDIVTKDDLQKAKMNLCKKYGLGELPGNAEILDAVDSTAGVEREDVVDILRRKPSRASSGVTVVAVMSSPAECPHGKCIMCPGGPASDKPSPQSYTGEEPAALRGRRHDYDPRAQVENRLNQYHAIGHPTDKVDLIVMGGTFPARSWVYQKEFVKGCFDALNGEISPTLEAAKTKNEKAKNRCIGLTVETRPDICGREELEHMIDLGVTRVELGVQTVKDHLLTTIERGHNVDDTVEATRLLKYYGLKVCYHIMPGLPGSSPEDDLKSFKIMFDDPRFRPDMIKIYPTLVIKGTKLFDMWNRDEYSPLSTEEAAELIAKMKSIVPPYVRIQRVQRDIPSPLVEGGVKHSNLRQYSRRALEDMGGECKCIRCREAGRTDDDIDLDKLELRTILYEAQGGQEYFIEFSADGILAAYARLRIAPDYPPTIRELKVVGEMTPIAQDGRSLQHTGYGKRLVRECERLAVESGQQMIRVTSGVGARDYYRSLGYHLKDEYMFKALQP